MLRTDRIVCEDENVRDSITVLARAWNVFAISVMCVCVCIYIYVCVRACVCVCARASARSLTVVIVIDWIKSEFWLRGRKNALMRSKRDIQFVCITPLPPFPLFYFTCLPQGCIISAPVRSCWDISFRILKRGAVFPLAGGIYCWIQIYIITFVKPQKVRME